MKKNSKKNVVSCDRIEGNGTVAGLITALKNYPEDTKVSVNGAISIDADNDIPAVSIDEVKSAIADVASTNEYLDEYMYGRPADFINNLRKSETEALVSYPKSMPLDYEIEYEKSLPNPYTSTIEEIRSSNIDFVEAMTELYRRQLACIIEYNTQCMARMAGASVDTMVTMCNVVSKENK